jgi:hypothetical protein
MSGERHAVRALRVMSALRAALLVLLLLVSVGTTVSAAASPVLGPSGSTSSLRHAFRSERVGPPVGQTIGQASRRAAVHVGVAEPDQSRASRRNGSEIFEVLTAAGLAGVLSLRRRRVGASPSTPRPSWRRAPVRGPPRLSAG